MSLCPVVISAAAGWVLAHPLVEAKARSLWARARPAPEEPSSLAKSIEALLKNYPEDWKEDQHTLDHKSGLQLWICGDEDHLKVWRFSNEGICSDEKIYFRACDRKLLWQAYKTWQREEQLRKSARAQQRLKALLEDQA